MEQLDLNVILDRKKEEKLLKDSLIYFENNKTKFNTYRGIYVYGSPGSGKTHFVKKILNSLNYDIITYDTGDIRNKNIIETIAQQNMSDISIISMFNKKVRKIAVIMDEIDGMNSGDKGGINSLIKLMRPKKTKKQKKENYAMVPIICISNYHIDKKITEMMKSCIKIELKTPSNNKINGICKLILPNIDNILLENVVNFIQGDLRKLDNIYELYSKHENSLKNKIILNIFKTKTLNEDTKQITKKILENKYLINDHNIIMNETDRTSVGLLFHENIIDILQNIEPTVKNSLYLKILNNICFSDYLDRITFQKQIWGFNEMSSIIKTFYNNMLLHESLSVEPIKNDIRFTKVLTKYSTEYNNSIFIQNLCQQLMMDKRDLISYFKYLYKNNTLEEIYKIFDDENYQITKLDIDRLYRYINAKLTD
jgi:hypothetical protein